MEIHLQESEANRVDNGFRPEVFEELYKLEADNFWFQNRGKLVVWALKKFFPHSQSLLEIGCGTGYMLLQISKEIPQLQLSGSEYFEEGLQFAAERLPNISLSTMDARELPMVNAFDVIGAFDVIEHIDEDELVLQQMHKACRQGIILTVPQHKFLWSQIDEYSCHKRRYSSKELENKLRNAGFTIEFQTSFVTLLLPLLLISRLIPKSRESFDPLQELRLNRILNWLFGVIVSIERLLIASGLKFFAGGSLIVVAQKLRNNA